MVAILMMSAKLATLGFLKVKIFWSKIYDVIISAHGVTKKHFWCYSNYTLDVVMWTKFGNSSISMREYREIVPQRPHFQKFFSRGNPQVRGRGKE